MSADLPSELVVTPQPLIGFTGLDINKNTVHRAIWDAFNNNRKNDRAQIQFKLLPSNYEYPVSKPKRQSYEWYHPKGILKRNWMLKHLHVLPGVIVLFKDIEWNDTAWPEKQLHCASLLQTLKNSLQGRNTKLVIVLIQKSAPLPAGEDLLSVERAASLTTKCDISPKMLFVLPHNEHLMGYTLRLESAFLELAQTYYAQMGKKVRVHRDQLTSAHQSLLIRHLFKLGFISEMKFDYNTALKNYSNAYGGLDEIRIIDANCLEMKTVAGFLNYKMCKMMFKLNSPRDSITQFKAHIEKYQGRTGYKELLFEHYAWMSVQYSAFAELFCDAIKNGLPALQTQHPGIYYHKAAEYIGKRKEAFLECCALTSSSLPSSPIETNSPAYTNIFYSDFFGVRGTKLSEPISDTQIIAVVQQKEKTFNHSVNIISLLGHAMAQYKIYRCPRFRKKLAVDMAEEYLKSGDHSKALTLYSLMLSDYRIDKWYTIFTEVLLKTLRSAFLSASVADFISCSIEAMSPKINIDTAERIVILENLWKVFQNVAPIAQAQSAPELKSSWEIALGNFKSPILIDLDKVSDLIECTLTFEKATIKHDETLNLELLIRSKAEIPLKLHEFAVILSDSQYHFKLIAKEYVEVLTIPGEINDDVVVVDNFRDFMLQPRKCYKICFHAGQYEFTENSELSIVCLQIIMGSNLHHAILTQSLTLNKVKNFKNYNSNIDLMENIKFFNSCYIIPTYHLVTQNNLSNQPMLVNEYFKVECTVTNPYDVTLQNIGMSITVPTTLRHKVYITTDLNKQRQKLLSQIQVDLGDLHAQSVSHIVYYVCSLCEGNIELAQKIWYQMDNSQIISASKNSYIERELIVESPSHKIQSTNPNIVNDRSNNQIKNHNMNIEYIPDGVKKVKDDVVIIPCVEEFNFQGRFYALNRQALTKAYRNEDFLFRANITIKSEHSIDILDMFVICDYNIIEKPYSRSRRKLSVPYQKGDKLHDVRLFRGTNTTCQWIRRVDFLFQQNKQQSNITPNDIFAGRRKSTERDLHLSTGNNVAALSISAAALAKKEDRYKSNLLAKIPINSTIIGSTNVLSSNTTTTTSSMNRSITEETKLKNKSTDTLMTSSFHESNSQTSIGGAGGDSTVILKNIYNRSLDSFLLTGHCKGFLKANTNTGNIDNSHNVLSLPDFGVYCIRWRRTGSTQENESKFVIGGIDIYEPPLNIYCYLDDKMYVKVPMTLRITISNPARTTLRLKTNLRTSENFIFAGNTQLNISIYANSSYDLSFNLYPLKAGWQNLPEFDVKYNNNSSSSSSGTTDGDGDAHIDDEQNYELQNLVNRWMPKRVFILPMLRSIK